MAIIDVAIGESAVGIASRAMVERVIVRRGAYHDSVTLMLVSRTAAAEDGAEDVAVGMATPLNLELLAGQGFAVSDAGPNDLVIALRTRDDAAADAVVAAVERELAAKPAGGGAVERAAPPSLAAAARRDPELSVAFLSIPGRYAVYEAAMALEAGMHVFCFSDGVGLADEAALKRRAIERGLLFMGADCGTAILDGVALGFANAVERGPVGIVGASGTGTQEICCLLDAAGVGVSHAIGVGGRDLSAEVGGVMMRRGLELLAGDPDTRAIVAVSKPPDPAVAAAIEAAAGVAGKPVILAFGGLDDAARRAAEAVGGSLPRFEERLRRPPAPGLVRGLYSGGTLCGEAARIVGDGDEPVAAGAERIVGGDEPVAAGAEPIVGGDEPVVAGTERIVGGGHAFVDFGADEFTQGRAHPMIDPSLRIEAIARAARDPAVTVVLLDVVLGYGAHPDPADALAPGLAGLRDDQHAIVALCGARADPQGLDRQRQAFLEAGAVVTRSNAHAARLAKEACGG
jgi:FdrA protein